MAGPTCQSIRGDGVDAAVARSFLEALQPAELTVALAALDDLEGPGAADRSPVAAAPGAGALRGGPGPRRFLAVEPEHRLVARSLEQEWNAKLADVERLEREATGPARPRAGQPQERQRILALAQDLPTVWQAPTTTHVERKQLRCLIKDVTLTKQAGTIHVAIRWQTEACTTLEVPRPRSADLRRTDPTVIRRIGELAPGHTDPANRRAPQ